MDSIHQSDYEIGPARAGMIIGILSFNRPSYLEKMLLSLRDQLRPDDRVFLFQDGGWNEHSRRKKASDAATDECAKIFSRLIVNGAAFVSPFNLGIAGNYRRAEKLFFEAMESEYALFLEDDMLLSPHYLDVTADLARFANEDEHIGYFSAYGDLWASVREQAKREPAIRPMHENWGSGMTRKSWMKQRPLREYYWGLIKNADYSERDHGKIRELYQGLGYTMPITSQDGSRWIACAEAKLARITTATCQGKYIGETGEHWNPTLYEQHRFTYSKFYHKRPRLSPPVPAQITEFARVERQRLVDGYTHPYSEAFKDLEQLKDLVGLIDLEESKNLKAPEDLEALKDSEAPKDLEIPKHLGESDTECAETAEPSIA